MLKPVRLPRFIVYSLLVILISSLLLSIWAYHRAVTPIDLPAYPYIFSIEPGSSLSRIATTLTENDILSDKWLFILVAYVTGSSTSLKAGEYELTEKLSLLQLLELLHRGKTKQHAIVLVEGWTFSQIKQVLDAHPAIKHDSAGLDHQELLQQIGASESHIEGLFFPDTYFFQKNNSDISILKRAYQAMQQHLKAAWQTRQKSLPLKNIYEGLILASIIEKETGMENERSQIAGVFTNRLRKRMKLQTDPTVIYGLGDKFEGRLRKIDLRTDHHYNTYTRFGLPPTPIAMPGLASIRAAFNPAATNALYFVARGDGTSHFSDTLAEHNRAVLKYQKKTAKTTARQ